MVSKPKGGIYFHKQKEIVAPEQNTEDRADEDRQEYFWRQESGKHVSARWNIRVRIQFGTYLQILGLRSQVFVAECLRRPLLIENEAGYLFRPWHLYFVFENVKAF